MTKIDDTFIKRILVAWDEKCGSKNTIGELILLRDLLSAAIEEERRGDVVIWDGTLSVYTGEDRVDYLPDVQLKHNLKRFIEGQRGSLIFRPSKEVGE